MRQTTIIFDLGGILLNLDFKKTAAAFTALGVNNFDQYFTQVHSNPLFKQLETGAVIDGGFYDSIRKAAAIGATDSEIDAAWNAMLLDFPTERIQKLKDLSKDHRLFLFSNTNAIHHAYFQQNFLDIYGFPFDTLFEKAWYSHIIGYRKPDIAAFEFILRDGGIDPADAIFIDDTLPNVEAAGQAGLKAIHLAPGMDILVVLDEIT